LSSGGESDFSTIANISIWSLWAMAAIGWSEHSVLR
jgi:hypothetical protein